MTVWYVVYTKEQAEAQAIDHLREIRSVYGSPLTGPRAARLGRSER